MNNRKKSKTVGHDQIEFDVRFRATGLIEHLTSLVSEHRLAIVAATGLLTTLVALLAMLKP